MKIAQIIPSVEDVAFAKKATHRKFYGRHAFDFDPRRALARGKDTFCTAEARAERDRTTPKWQLVRSVPYTGMVPHGVACQTPWCHLPTMFPPSTTIVRQPHHHLQRTFSGFVNGKTPQAHMCIISTLSACFRRGSRQRHSSANRPDGVLEYSAAWHHKVAIYEQGMLHESKTTLARHHNYLYNVTDVEHFIRSTQRVASKIPNAAPVCNSCTWTRRVSLRLTCEASAMWFIVSPKVLAWLRLVPGEVGGPGYHLRTTQARGAVVLLQNEARSMWPTASRMAAHTSTCSTPCTRMSEI